MRPSAAAVDDSSNQPVPLALISASRRVQRRKNSCARTSSRHRAKVLRLCRRHECVRNEKARARRIDSLDIDAYPDVPCHGVEREPAGVGDAERDSDLAGSACRRRSARSGAKPVVGRCTRRAVREGHPERDPIGRRRAHRRTRRVVASRRRSDWLRMPRVDVVAGEPHSPHVHVTGFQRRRDGRAPGVRLTPQRESTLARAPRTATARSSTPGGRRTLSCR